MLPDKELNDKELIAQYLAGADDVIDIIQGWIEKAAQPFRLKLGNEWQDALQNVQLEITIALREGKFRQASRLKTYVGTVTVHTCLDHLRRTARRRSSVELDAIGEWPGPAVDSPARQLWEKEQWQIFLWIQSQMPPECQELWTLTKEGLTYEEISKKLNASPEAIGQRGGRCKKKAQALWVDLCKGKIKYNVEFFWDRRLSKEKD